MPKQVNVQLGGRGYTVSEKVAGIQAAWRQHLRQSAVFQTLQSLDGVVEMVAKALEESRSSFDVGQVAALAHIVPAAILNLSNSMDDISALVFDYIPEMQEDREWIMANVYDSELVAAFVEVLKLNFPIMGVWGLVTGFRAPGTSTNLPTPNGAIGTRPPTARRKIR
jgi:hypothetical protein